MLKRNKSFLFDGICSLGICGGVCAIAFLGEFAVPVPVSAEPQWPLMHASVVEIMFAPATPAAMKE